LTGNFLARREFNHDSTPEKTNIIYRRGCGEQRAVHNHNKALGPVMADAIN